VYSRQKKLVSRKYTKLKDIHVDTLRVGTGQYSSQTSESFTHIEMKPHFILHIVPSLIVVRKPYADEKYPIGWEGGHYYFLSNCILLVLGAVGPNKTFIKGTRIVLSFLL